MNWFGKKLSLVGRWVLCGVVALALVPTGAWASATCTRQVSSMAISGLPAKVAVARDLPVGSMLTVWGSTPNNPNLFLCSSTGLTYTGAAFWYGGGLVIQGTRTSATVTYNGVTTGVFPTNVPGVGIALIGTANSKTKSVTGAFAFEQYDANNGTNFGNGGQLTVALVKIGPITPGIVSGGTVSQVNVLMGGTDPASVIFPAGLAPSIGVVDITMNPVEISVLTCTTPDKTIVLGQYMPSDLPSIGRAPSRSTAFSLEVNDCPIGSAVTGTDAGLIHSVQYRIDPSNGTVSGFTNVAALGGSSTAGGVGIQLYDGNDTVFPFGTYITLNGFSGTAGGSYTVPMTARYYRTGILTAGPANTTMTMTVLYQ